MRSHLYRSFHKLSYTVHIDTFIDPALCNEPLNLIVIRCVVVVTFSCIRVIRPVQCHITHVIGIESGTLVDPTHRLEPSCLACVRSIVMISARCIGVIRKRLITRCLPCHAEECNTEQNTPRSYKLLQLEHVVVIGK